MAEQTDALRTRNQHLLTELQNQAEHLHELSSQSSVCQRLTGNRETERTGEPTLYKPNTTPETLVKQFHGDCKAPVPGQHKHKHPSALTAHSRLRQDTGDKRWHGHGRTTRLMLPKTAPLTQREFDSTTSLSHGLENDTTSERRRIQPLLGYDWIAGLVDVESSLAERSEQFFSELQSFRQVNRDECVHSSPSGPPLVADLASFAVEGEEPQEPADMHQCTFCYRINSRLFAAPLDPQAACPVCKMAKSDHPHTDAEPAIIRVSIPRSTLLPSYKHRAHRRSSFDPSDSLDLPSHCLSGWSNPSLNSGSLMNSLDLRGSLETPAARSTLSSSNNKLDSSLSRHQRTNLHILPQHQFQHLDSPETLY